MEMDVINVDILNVNNLSSVNLHAKCAVLTMAKLDAVNISGDCKCD